MATVLAVISIHAESCATADRRDRMYELVESHGFREVRIEMLERIVAMLVKLARSFEGR